MLMPWLVVLIIALILVLDVLILAGLAALAVMFVAFHAGRLTHVLLNWAMDRAVHALLFLLEGAVAAPPMSRVPLLARALAGVKLTYGLVNAGQSTLERSVALLVTGLAAALSFAAVGVLLAINLYALWLALSYHLL